MDRSGHADAEDGVLLMCVKKDVYERDEEVQRVLREKGFANVQEIAKHLVFLPSAVLSQAPDGDEHDAVDAWVLDLQNATSSDEPQVITFSTVDSGDGSHRGRPEADEDQGIPQSRATFSTMTKGKWELSGSTLQELGLESLHLTIELLIDIGETINVNSRLAKDVTLAMGSVSIVQKRATSTPSRRVVHSIEITLKPLGRAKEGCMYLKVCPDASRGIGDTPMTIQRGSGQEVSLTPGQYHNPVQVKASVSKSVTKQDVHQQDWSARPYGSAATWTWSILRDNKGRRFDPAKATLLKLQGGELTDKLLKQLIPEPLIRSTFQLSSVDGVKATWTMPEESLNGASDIQFGIGAVVHTTAITRASVVQGLARWSTGKTNHLHKARCRGIIPIDLVGYVDSRDMDLGDAA